MQSPVLAAALDTAVDACVQLVNDNPRVTARGVSLALAVMNTIDAPLAARAVSGPLLQHNGYNGYNSLYEYFAYLFDGSEDVAQYLHASDYLDTLHLYKTVLQEDPRHHGLHGLVRFAEEMGDGVDDLDTPAMQFAIEVFESLEATHSCQVQIDFLVSKTTATTASVA